jgi:methyl-accepting chemotaxis protein
VSARSRRLTLAQRLYLTSGALVLALLAVAVAVVVLMSEVGSHARFVEQVRVPQLQRIAQLELELTRVSLQLRHAILARTPEERDAALADADAKRRALGETLEAVGRGMVTPEGKAVFAPWPELLRAFGTVVDENVALIREGRTSEAFAFLADRTGPVRDRLLAPLSSEKARQGERLGGAVAAIVGESETARNAVLAAVIAVCLGQLAFAVYLVRTMRRLGGEPDALKDVASAVAAGRLDTEIALRAGDADSVMAALRTMRDELAHTVGTVRTNADAVAGASAQIASGNADLSARTESQASALQQTAASMEELAATVRQNADNAQEADRLAAEAAQVAERGGSTVREVVDTMRGIHDSSRRIAEINAVIDGIAFQTNILALNAAVEAARAGEQGRGFAVVAGEVRTLAQRAAQAAREIKSLIEDSVGRVDQGTSLVDRAGADMQEIVAAIRRVAGIVGEISGASDEQARGVSQIGEAVSQMDRGTQQNAALVEESAAAADSLRQQAHALVGAVSTFRLA